MKEDTHLYRIFKERIPMPEQGKAMSIMASTIPQERFAELVAWLYPLIGHDDRENMTRIWQMVMPAPVFSAVKELIRKDCWQRLGRTVTSHPGHVGTQIRNGKKSKISP